MSGPPSFALGLVAASPLSALLWLLLIDALIGWPA